MFLGNNFGPVPGQGEVGASSGTLFSPSGPPLECGQIRNMEPSNYRLLCFCKTAVVATRIDTTSYSQFVQLPLVHYYRIEL